MKKITISIVAAIFAVGAMAQNFNLQQGPSFPFKNYQNDKAVDTLMAPVFYTGNPCADTLTYFGLGPQGYLTGNGTLSGFPFAECATAYDFTGTGTVTGVVAYMTSITGTTGNVSAKIYAVDGTMKPTTQSGGASNNFSMSAMTPGQINVVPLSFATPPSVSGNFAASIVYPTTAGDTVVVFCTNPGCVNSSKDGYGYFLLGTVNQWMQYKSVLSQNSYPSVDLFIAAIVNTSGSGVEDNKVSQQASVYPNPAKDKITIASLNKINNVKLLNSLGQVVLNENVNTLVHFVSISDLQEGVYFVQLETAEGSVTKRFVVSR